MTDAEWALTEPFMPPGKPLGQPCTTDLREVVNAPLYPLRGGGHWHILPKDFSPRSMV